MLEIEGRAEKLFVKEVQALTDDEPQDVIYVLCVGNDEEDIKTVEDRDSLFVEDTVFAIAECETSGETEETGEIDTFADFEKSLVPV